MLQVKFMVSIIISLLWVRDNIVSVMVLAFGLEKIVLNLGDKIGRSPEVRSSRLAWPA